MSSGLTNDFPQPGDVYRHQNGIDYRVDLLARVDNEEQDLMVVATGPDGISWARKIGNFLGLKEGKPRFVKVDSNIAHPGVTYTGHSRQGRAEDGCRATVEFEPGAAKSVSESLQVIKAHKGSWELLKDGVLRLKVFDEGFVRPYAVINGVTYINQAELEKSWLNLADLKVEPANYSVHVSQTDNGQPYVSGMHLSDEYHWNKPEDLPPVGCELLIKVPAGTKVHLGDARGVNVSYDTDVERIFKVFRTSHLADRAGAMDYRLPDNCIVTGRFPWTYP